MSDQLTSAAIAAPTERLDVLVPLALKRVIHRAAAAQNVSVAEFVRGAIAERILRDAQAAGASSESEQ